MAPSTKSFKFADCVYCEIFKKREWWKRKANDYLSFKQLNSDIPFPESKFSKN